MSTNSARLRPSLRWSGLAILAAAGLLWLRSFSPEMSMKTPFDLAIPASCLQLLRVESPSIASPTGEMRLLERASDTAAWRPYGAPFPITLGHNGLGWGLGLQPAAPPSEFPEKVEGDKRSPAGLFRLPSVFGMATDGDAAFLKMPYIALRPGIIGVDDPKSAHYNQIVDSSRVKRDWDSNESMSRHKKLYQWGAFVGHNPDQIPGRGSCIFLHLWPGAGRSTSGCTAMSAEDLETVIRWLDASKDPCLVQFVAD